jgi:hypothetical protein
MCWDQNGRVHRYEHKSRSWVELELTGDKLPGAYVDNSSIVYDSKRDRLLVVNTLGYEKPFDGHVWAVDLKTSEVKGLKPAGMELADQFAKIDKSCYDPVNDLLLLVSHMKDAGGHTPKTDYDAAKNSWVLLDIAYEVQKDGEYTRRKFPNERSDALMFDAKRKLIWGCDTNGQVYVLRLDAAKANIRALE